MPAANSITLRVITALVLAPLTVAAILGLPTPDFALVFALVVLLAAWEWTALTGISSMPGRLAYIASTAVLLVLLWQIPLRDWSAYLLFLPGIWWLGIVVFLFRVRDVERSVSIDWMLIPAGFLVLLGPWVAMVRLHDVADHGPVLVLFLMVLIWVADSAAFFVGRAWGRTKLAPRLSPGKTWAGVYGALAGAALCGVFLAWGLDSTGLSLLYTVLLCTVTASISVVGDLYESWLKRHRGIKDSGRLLPGHGGILDRIDSLTAAAPIFTLGILWLEAGL